MRSKIILMILGLLSTCQAWAQLCTNPGQTPATAVLVCGVESFNVSTTQFCGQTNIPTPCPAGSNYLNLNPNFFRMACYSSGTLGFTIVPSDPNVNFDWQLFDITNTNPDDVFTNPGLFIACNWSSEPGETGASTDGNDLIVCAGSGQALFSKMPDLQRARTYLLMVSNQSGSSSPYQLTFTGGSASITDAVDPHLKAARLSCDGDKVIVRMNKEMKCGSLSPNGSDFTITGGASIIAAHPGDCTSMFGSDSITLTLNQPLVNGNYTLTILNGSDGNTMTDMCNRTIPPGESIPLLVVPLLPTPLDSVYPVTCAPSYIELVFRKPMRCNTIAADGTDFILSGPQAVTVSSVNNNCGGNGMVSVVRLNLSSQLVTAGTYLIQLITGSDGNTLADECGLLTVSGSTVSFEIKDTVSAFFTYSVAPSCKENTVAYLHPGGNGINSWQWNVGTSFSGNMPNPVINYPTAIQYNVQLTVSNGFCTDTYSQPVAVDNQVKAAFEMPSLICPGDELTILNKSTGSIDYWEWNFGNGNTSAADTPPPQHFAAGNSERQYVIQLIAGNTSIDCRDTVTKVLKVPVNCIIALPSAFTPNNDGRNDHFYPINAHKARDLDFKIFNRYGQLVFTSRDPNRKWNGQLNGLPQPAGVYVWMLNYTDVDSNKKIFMKGTTMLLR